MHKGLPSAMLRGKHHQAILTSGLTEQLTVVLWMQQLQPLTTDRTGHPPVQASRPDMLNPFTSSCYGRRLLSCEVLWQPARSQWHAFARRPCASRLPCCLAHSSLASQAVAQAHLHAGWTKWPHCWSTACTDLLLLCKLAMPWALRQQLLVLVASISAVRGKGVEK